MIIPKVRRSGIPKIRDKWKPCNGIFIKAFVSVSGNFNNVMIFEKSDKRRVINEDKVNKQKQINEAHHAHNFNFNVPKISMIKNNMDIVITMKPDKSINHSTKNGKSPLKNKSI